MNHPKLLYQMALDRHRELVAEADEYRLAMPLRATRRPFPLVANKLRRGTP